MTDRTLHSMLALSGGNLQHLTVSQIIDLAVELKAPRLELNMGQNYSSVADAEKVQAACEKHEISVPVTNTFLYRSMAELQAGSDTEAVFDECIEIARVFGSKYVLIYCPCQPKDIVGDAASQVEVEQFLPFVSRALKKCDALDATLVIENHPDSLLRSIDASLDLLKRADGLKLAFDPANYYNAGEEAFPLAYGLLADYVEVLHVKDPSRFDERVFTGDTKVVQRVVKGSLIRGVFSDLGEGAINWDGLLRRLRADSFHGPVILEPYTHLSLLDSAFRSSAAFLSKY